MNERLTESAETWGLVANGSSGGWAVAVDELQNRSEWSLEIDGPEVYLVFQLEDLQVIAKAASFLDADCFSRESPDSREQPDEGVLHLGQFANASVSLVRDDEGFPRYFLVVGLAGRSTLRVTLEGEAISMLRTALREALSDLQSSQS
jgi:hypothetical protein